jgi:hypothetical protein
MKLLKKVKAKTYTQKPKVVILANFIGKNQSHTKVEVFTTKYV